MRVVGGRFRGRVLAAPKSQSIRPTTDRARETLFNMLAARTGISGARVIDLFAGTGALGLEALSRGAAFALFVDNSAEAARIVLANIESLGVAGSTRIRRGDTQRLGRCGAEERYDIAFADPPYDKGLGEVAARALAEGGWLRSGALFVLEETPGSLPGALEGYELIEEKRIGQSAFAFYRFRGAAGATHDHVKMTKD